MSRPGPRRTKARDCPEPSRFSTYLYGTCNPGSRIYGIIRLPDVIIVVEGLYREPRTAYRATLHRTVHSLALFDLFASRDPQAAMRCTRLDFSLESSQASIQQQGNFESETTIAFYKNCTKNSASLYSSDSPIICFTSQTSDNFLIQWFITMYRNMQSSEQELAMFSQATASTTWPSPLCRLITNWISYKTAI